MNVSENEEMGRNVHHGSTVKGALWVRATGLFGLMRLVSRAVCTHSTDGLENSTCQGVLLTATSGKQHSFVCSSAVNR